MLSMNYRGWLDVAIEPLYNLDLLPRSKYDTHPSPLNTRTPRSRANLSGEELLGRPSSLGRLSKGNPAVNTVDVMESNQQTDSRSDALPHTFEKKCISFDSLVIGDRHNNSPSPNFSNTSSSKHITATLESSTDRNPTNYFWDDTYSSSVTINSKTAGNKTDSLISEACGIDYRTDDDDDDDEDEETETDADERASNQLTLKHEDSIHASRPLENKPHGNEPTLIQRQPQSTSIAELPQSGKNDVDDPCLIDKSPAIIDTTHHGRLERPKRKRGMSIYIPGEITFERKYLILRDRVLFIFDHNPVRPTLLLNEKNVYIN